MKAIPFVCICLLLLSAFVLTEARRDNHIVFIAAMEGPVKILPLDGCHGCTIEVDWNGNRPEGAQQGIFWYRDASRDIALIRATDQPFKSRPAPKYSKWTVFDDGPFGCDYFSCDDIEVLLPPRPQCLFGNCEFEDTLWKTKYWRMKHRQG